MEYARREPSLGNGLTEAPGVLFDMNKLFEAHVTELVAAQAEDGERVQAQGPQRALSEWQGQSMFTLRPDVTVSRFDGSQGDEFIVRIVDAKWKRLNPNALDYDVQEADVYQLMAYAVRYGCKEVELYYPRPLGMPTGSVPPSLRIDGSGLATSIQIRLQLVEMAS